MSNSREPRPLAAIPSSSGGPVANGPTSQVISLSKRKITLVACEQCRERRLKCDGKRPQCGRCRDTNHRCVFESEDPHTSRHTARKVINTRVIAENTAYAELFQYLYSKPAVEAFEIYRRIRMSSDPFAVLADIKGAQVLLNSPVTRDPDHGYIQRLNATTLDASPLKVPATPWTTVAGDGIVSHLISSYFMWDNSFYTPFVPQSAFLDDMRSGNVRTAKYCSPSLVNAICAVRCFTSGPVNALSSVVQYDVGARFLAQTKRLLDAETGRASLTTVQALALMFLAAAFSGTDRSGLPYRYSACTMLQALRLEQKLSRPNAYSQKDYDALTFAVWGFFSFESITAWVYMQPALISPPTVVCRDLVLDELEAPAFVNLLGDEYIEDSQDTPLIPATFKTVCGLSVFLYKVMCENTDSEVSSGSPEDLARRHGFLAELLLLKERLPDQLVAGNEPTHQQCYVNVLINLIEMSIVRPLKMSQKVAYGDCTVKELLLCVCENSVNTLQRFFERYKPVEYSSMLLCGAYSSALTLVAFLEDVRSHITFAGACYLLHFTTRHLTMTKYILQGLRAMAWSLDLQIPKEAMPYFADKDVTKDALRDVPISFSIPTYSDVRSSLAALPEDQVESKTYMELGHLLSKWSRLSM